MSNQYPGPPQQPTPPPGYLQQPPQAPYGAPGGGGGYPPPQFGAPPTGGGGGKKLAIILGIVGAVVLLIIAAVVVILLVAGDDDDDPRPKVTQTVTVDATDGTTDSTTDGTTDGTTDSTTPPTTEATSTAGGTLSPEGAEIIARAYLNSLVTSNCLAVQGLSTPEWFSSEYGDQAGCEAAGGNAEMASVDYEFGETVENGDGTVGVTAVVADSSDTTGTSYTATWTMVPSADNTSWLVDAFALADA